MAMDQSALLELLELLKAADVDDRIRVAAQILYQPLIYAEAAEMDGAGRWERTDGRMAVRNGSRSRVLWTTAGDVTQKLVQTTTLPTDMAVSLRDTCEIGRNASATHSVNQADRRSNLPVE